MNLTPIDAARFRDELRERWYREGWYTPRTLIDEFDLGAATRPDAELVFASDTRPDRMTLTDLQRESREAAAAFQGLGVEKGDVIVIQVPHSREGIVALYAGLIVGAVVVPVVHIYGPSELAFILRQSRAKMLIVPDRWRNIDFLTRVEALPELPDLRHVVVIGDDVPADAVAWSGLPSRVRGPFLPPEIRSDDVCIMVYTSGTTADPKGVQHTHNSFRCEMQSAPHNAGEEVEHSFLATFPAGHIGGLITQTRLSFVGSKIVIMDAWNPDTAARLIAEHAITIAGGTPFFLDGLLTAAERNGSDVSSLREFRVSAASVPPSLVERAVAAGILTYRAYGSSEHPTISSGSATDPPETRIGTDGRLVTGVEIRLVGDDLEDVAAGQDGEIVSRGPDLFAGYLDSQLDADAFLDGGWFRTGDVGRLYGGFLTITDRKKDIIIRGGENISSKEVEDILARHPAVADAAAAAVPDATYGERVCAFVILHEGATLDLAEIGRHFVSSGVAKHKTPERLVFVDELPRTPAGKVKKFELREAYASRLSVTR